jgi:Leucine-rich repeat (LRR) protein
MDKITHYEIPDGVTEIPKILLQMKNLKSLVIPKSVSIPYYGELDDFMGTIETLTIYCKKDTHYGSFNGVSLKTLTIIGVVYVSYVYPNVAETKSGINLSRCSNIEKLIVHNAIVEGVVDKITHLEMYNSCVTSGGKYYMYKNTDGNWINVCPEVVVAPKLITNLKTFITHNSSYICRKSNPNGEWIPFNDNITMEVLHGEMPNAKQVNLRELKIYKNVKEIPTFVYELPSLDDIMFETCDINKLFNNIMRKCKIRHIAVKASFVHEISPNIKFLEHLETLDLSNNLIFTLPAELFKLPYLADLNLSGNYLENLPDDVMNAKALKTLNVKNNKINKLSYQLHEFLTQLDFISDDIVFESNPMFKYAEYKDKLLELYKNNGICVRDPFDYDRAEYPDYVIDKICELLEHLEPFELPNYQDDLFYTDDTKQKLKMFILNDNMILLGKINFLMVFIALNNLMNKSGEVFLQKTKVRINAAKFADPYMMILSAIK